MADNIELYGRQQIFTSVDVIDSSNVAEVLDAAIGTHEKNVKQIEYLHNYFKGKTDILERKKKIRTDIVNQINENRAKEIVDFKTAYLVGEDVVYSSFNDENTEKIELLNQFMRLEGKSTADYDLVEWQMIAGTSYRLILPKTFEDEVNGIENNRPEEEGDSPFTIDTIDPRNAFVIYSSGIHREPVACVYMTTDDDDVTTYWVYTHTNCFKVIEDEVTQFDWTLYYLPIIEYPANSVRMGAFEAVVPLLNAINTLDSNRMDGIEQFIQALLVLINCKLPEGYTTSDVAEQGLIELISNADNPAKIELLCQQLDQQQTQTLKDDFYNAVLTICSMPNRHSNSSSTSDNGVAVLYRDGWSSAETASRTSQKIFDRSEYRALRLILTICRETGAVDIPISAIKIDFTRNHYENLETKTTVLIQLLSNEKVHPLVAYEVCGLFADPNEKYLMGMEWFNREGTTGNDAEGEGTEDIPTSV